MKNWSLVIPLAIFALAFLFRITGILHHYPFWVDEFSTAVQGRHYAQYGLGVFHQNLNIEGNNYTFHALVALFFKVFGENEFAARLPAVIFGSLMPVAAYFTAKKLFNSRTALIAALLAICSYFMIVWSDQARSYPLLQVFTLVTIYYYWNLIQPARKTSDYILFILSTTLGFLTHAQFIILIIAFGIHFFVIKMSPLIAFTKKRPVISIIGFLIGGLFLAHMSRQGAVSPTGVNNLWYYHSFMWREYGMISLIALFGILVAFVTKRTQALLILIYTGLHLTFFAFIFKPYVTRYLLPMFPLVFMSFAYAVTYFTDLVLDQQKFKEGKYFNKTHLKALIPIVLVLFILGNGYKFVYKPKPYYSVNHDFREISNVNYDEVYNLIKTKGNLSENKTAVIDTWHDRLFWYIGDSYRPSYLFKWDHEPSEMNGLPKKTDYKINEKGEKYMPRMKGLRFIGNLAEFKRAMTAYPRGFIFIDDVSLPADVIEYVEKNLKKELFLDRNPLDDNPYSVWPATLYSWGIN